MRKTKQLKKANYSRSDVRKCAHYFHDEFIMKYYVLTTYNNDTFILVSNTSNFAHLVGIKRNDIRSCGYRNSTLLYEDIISGKKVPSNLIPNNINPLSKMGKKLSNFQQLGQLLNQKSVSIMFDPLLSSTRLNKVDILISDYVSGMSMGWVFDKCIYMTDSISMNIYNPSSVINEVGQPLMDREKYYANQKVQILKSIEIHNKNHNTLSKKVNHFIRIEKINLLKTFERNRMNFICDKNYAKSYIQIAKTYNIHCLINGVLY